MILDGIVYFTCGCLLAHLLLQPEPTPCDKLPYGIVDANGVEHRTACHGYTVINADSVELCNGVKIKYSKNKPINVIPKNGDNYGKNSKNNKDNF